MFKNIPNKDNIHKPQTKVELSNFQNMISSEMHSTLSNNLKLNINSNFEPELLTDEVSIEPSKNKFNVLSFMNEKDKLPEKKEENENENKEEKHVLNKLDSMSTVFIGSISILGLYCVYKAIKKTM
tara:strand:+ start:28843 stop:29220 length:378 start_codon:yes stop_codon:yes gene_type:complete